jgi:S1-C subfamily serine protease
MSGFRPQVKEKEQTMKRITMAVLALSLASASVAPAQQTQQSRDQLERQLKDLQQQVQELRQQLRDAQGTSRAPRATTGVSPRVYSSAPNTRVFMYDGKPHLGVSVGLERNAATDSIGASLIDVTSGGPAAEAGIKEGDIITKFNGETLTGRYPAADDDQSEPGVKLIDLAGRLKDGDTVKLEYRRGRETKTATVVARKLSEGTGYSFSYGEGNSMSPFFRVAPPGFGGTLEPGELMRSFVFGGDSWLNLETVSINAELGEYFGTTKGLLVLHTPRDSSLSLKAGDVILGVDGRDVTTATQLMRVLRSYDAGETVKLDVMRQKRRVTLTGKIPESNENRMRTPRPARERRGEQG